MRYALLFPGQGSQSVGMLGDISRSYLQIQATLNEASEVLGWDVAGLVATGPESELNRTERTQPALLAAEVALWRAWQSTSPPTPAMLAGHSLGEYSALVCSGALAFPDALKLVELRGQLMQQASAGKQAGMAAVLGLDEDGISKLCAAYGGGGFLQPANYNAPGQVVVAADAAALEWLKTSGKAHGARKVMELAVSVPSHCELMRGASERLAETLTAIDIGEPAIPVLHNLDAQPRSTAQAIRRALAEQLYRPVRWVQIILAMQQAGVSMYLECGPGKVLAGLNRRMTEGSESYSLEEAGHFHCARDLLGPASPALRYAGRGGSSMRREFVKVPYPGPDGGAGI